MRIGLVADTHMPRYGRALPRALAAALRAQGVSLLLHAGDFVGPEVPGWFEAIAPLEAVAGNNDGPELVARYGRRRIVEAAGARIGLVHGDGPRGTTLGRALEAFTGEGLDAIVFGHSHIPYLARHNETWVINPGSPSDRRREPRYSFGILEIEAGRVRPLIFTYAERQGESWELAYSPERPTPPRGRPIA